MGSSRGDSRLSCIVECGILESATASHSQPQAGRQVLDQCDGKRMLPRLDASAISPQGPASRVGEFRDLDGRRKAVT